jgi:hypothetical protein
MNSNPIRAEAVERAARAMTAKRVELLCKRLGMDGVPGWDEYTDEGKDDAREEARAALEAGSGDGGLREALKPFADAIEEWGGDRAEPQKVSVWEHPIAMLVSVEDFWRAYDAVRTALSRSDGMGGMRPCYGERMPESDPIAEQFIERLKQTMAADIGRFVRAGRTPEQIVDGLMDIPEVRQAIELRAKGLTAIKRMG